jgi:hypothetical protein
MHRDQHGHQTGELRMWLNRGRYYSTLEYRRGFIRQLADISMNA